MDTPPRMDLLKALVAPGRHSEGPTLYMICRAADGVGCDIHEQMPDGSCVVWPIPAPRGIQQAEATIYQWVRERQESSGA